TSAPQSSITDDFLPLSFGGFLVTQMGSASGGAPGRLAEFDAGLHLIKEWPDDPPPDGFNPHGISVRPESNLVVTSGFIPPEITLMVTSTFILPAGTLNVVPGDPVLRGSIRGWDFGARKIVRTVQIPTALGLMDVRLIPGDAQARAFTAGMFDGLVYLIDTK